MSIDLRTYEPPSVPVRAQRGQDLRARQWSTEGLLRLLENVLEVGENPADLVVYAAMGKAARNWKSYYEIRRALLTLREDETLLIQSGQPVGVFRTQPSAPRVLLANSNLVGRWATPEHFYDLYRRGKIAWGGLTAGCWQYIGFQGVLQGTFETFSLAAASRRSQDDLAGLWLVTAGLGGMGSAQPLAAKLLGGSLLVAEIDGDRARKRHEAGLVDRVTDDLSQALAWTLEARDQKQPLTVVWVGNAVELLETLVDRNLVPDIVTDMTSAHDPRFGYAPVGLTLDQVREKRESDPEGLERLSRQSIVRHVSALLRLGGQGALAFDYGNNLRSQAHLGGLAEAFSLPVFTEAFLRPLFCRGIGPFRWVALTGNPADIATIDSLVLELFPDEPRVVRWIRAAREHVPFQGLPARTAWLGHGQRSALAAEVNRAIGDGRISGPVSFSRDHLDAGAMAHPNIMTENLKDGTDAVSDWPLLNALLNASNGADLVAIHAGGGGYAGYMQSAGVTLVADGRPETSDRLVRTLEGDTGLGVLRYDDAGYDEAQSTAQVAGLHQWRTR
jgi:urocanate hydratase